MEKKKMSTKVKKNLCLKWGRILVQIIFFLLAPALFSQAFGGVKEIFQALGNGDKFVMSAFLLRLFWLCGLTILLGRIFCGFACAFGALGDWIYQFSAFCQKKAGKKLPAIPKTLFPFLQKLKYVVLAGILLLCFFGKNESVTRYSPWTVFSLLTAGKLTFQGYFAAWLLLLLILVGMAVQERFFCQFLCPMGAVFALLPQLPFLDLKRQESSCIPKCQACKNNCPVHIKLQEAPLQEGECIRCGRCMLGCPKKNIKPGILAFLKNRKESIKRPEGIGSN